MFYLFFLTACYLFSLKVCYPFSLNMIYLFSVTVCYLFSRKSYSTNYIAYTYFWYLNLSCLHTPTPPFTTIVLPPPPLPCQTIVSVSGHHTHTQLRVVLVPMVTEHTCITMCISYCRHSRRTDTNPSQSFQVGKDHTSCVVFFIMYALNYRHSCVQCIRNVTKKHRCALSSSEP